MAVSHRRPARCIGSSGTPSDENASQRQSLPCRRCCSVQISETFVCDRRRLGARGGQLQNNALCFGSSAQAGGGRPRLALGMFVVLPVTLLSVLRSSLTLHWQTFGQTYRRSPLLALISPPFFASRHRRLSRYPAVGTESLCPSLFLLWFFSSRPIFAKPL